MLTNVLPKGEVKAPSKKKFSKNTALVYVGLVLSSLIVILPFMVVLLTSLKTQQDATKYPLAWFGPNGISFEGYRIALTTTTSVEMLGGAEMPILLVGFFWTLIVSVVPTVCSVMVASLAAFAFAKIRFKCSKVFFNILIFTMMIPGTILLIPHYLMYEQLGWVHNEYYSLLALIVPGLWGGAGQIFFIRQFMYSIPDSLIEAAKMDGLNWFKIYTKIILPLIVPAILCQGLLGFIAHYNAYLGPLMYLSGEYKTLQILIQTFIQQFAANNIPARMAVSIVSIIPTLLIYVIFQKYFVEGISTTGMKL